MMQTTREQLEKLIKKYKDYIELYKFYNRGSTEGITTFDVFYWRFLYHVKHEDVSKAQVGRF